MEVVGIRNPCGTPGYVVMCGGGSVPPLGDQRSRRRLDTSVSSSEIGPLGKATFADDRGAVAQVRGWGE